MPSALHVYCKGMPLKPMFLLVLKIQFLVKIIMFACGTF